MKPISICGMSILLMTGSLVAADPAAAPPQSSPPVKGAVEAAVAVYVDVVPACPRPGCWAVAYEALQRMEGVGTVSPKAEDSSLVRVWLSEPRLPDPRAWETTFRKYVGTAVEFRGVVVELTGTVADQEEGLVLTAPGIEPIRLAVAGRSLRLTKKNAGRADEGRPATVDAGRGVALLRATVTGALRIDDAGYSLEVRKLAVIPAD
jgi:hypothetical protein